MAPSTNNPGEFCARTFIAKLHLCLLEDISLDSDRLEEVIDLADKDCRVPANSSQQDKLLAIVQLRETLIALNVGKNQDTGEKELEKNLKLDLSALISLNISDLPRLVTMMRKVLTLDPSLAPSTFDDTKASQVSSVAIQWQQKMQQELEKPRMLPDAPLPQVSSSSDRRGSFKSRADNRNKAPSTKGKSRSRSTSELRHKLQRSRIREESVSTPQLHPSTRNKLRPTPPQPSSGPSIIEA